MTEELDHLEANNPRPKFLTVLCILSFISTGLGFISSFINLLSGPAGEEEMLNQKVEMTKAISDLRQVGMDSFVDLMTKIQAMTEEINDHFYLASILALITVGLGLFGVFKMWKGFKIGFHLYIVYCLFSIGIMYLYVSPSNIPTMIVIFNLIFSGLFIFMYSRNLNWLK